MSHHFLDFNTITLSDWNNLLNQAKYIMNRPAEYHSTCSGQVMATLFYEPSTRTQFSFKAAFSRLGGSVIGFSDPDASSVSKGENIKDTIRICASYTDIIVIRHYLEGAALAASLYSPVPVINAGDGGHLHPTQTLTDLFTLYMEKGKMTDLKIGICGDLLNGRTVHSLLRAMSLFHGNKFYLISTNELKIPDYVREHLATSGNEFIECHTMEECIGEIDVLYMTRIQKERFASPEDYEKQRGVYVLDTKKLALAKPDLIVMHPLPKVDEITPEADDDPRCIYIKQAKYGMFIRMALISSLLDGAVIPNNNYKKIDKKCQNKKCITNHEAYLPALTLNNLNCAYCDKKY